MINLLPTDVRDTITYARRNTILLRWLIVFLVGFIGIAFVVVAGIIYINASSSQVSKQVDQAKLDLKTQKLEETQTRVEDMSNSFKLVSQVLSKQVLFSEVLKQVGAVMPRGASLASLSVEQLQGGIDLQIGAVDYQSATQVQVNLEDPKNKLFEKVDIVSINCTPTATETTYPCAGRLRALFNKDNNPFLFLSSDSSETQR